MGYIAEIGHILGNFGTIFQHVGNMFTITANRLTRETDEEPHPEGDVYSDSQIAGRQEPSELHSDRRGQSIDDDDDGAYRIGFNNDHTRKP